MGIKRIRLRDDLYDYLKRRAKRHFRQPAGELNTILLELMDKENHETELAEKVVQLVPFPDDQRGPLPTQSGYRGVYTHGKAWMVRATRDGQKVKIGVYATPEEAAQAYDDYIRGFVQEHGGLAPLNFPREGEEQAMPSLDGGWPDEETRIMATQPPLASDLPEYLQRGLFRIDDVRIDDAVNTNPEPVPDPDIDPDLGPTLKPASRYGSHELIDTELPNPGYTPKPALGRRHWLTDAKSPDPDTEVISSAAPPDSDPETTSSAASPELPDSDPEAAPSA